MNEITLDCDVLKVPEGDIRIVTYTAAPGTPDADKLSSLLDNLAIGPHSEPISPTTAFADS